MLLPAGLRGLPLEFPDCLLPAVPLTPEPEFHLHPRYRTPRPLDALLVETQAGSDEFVTEKYADQINVVLREWRKSLLQSPSEAGGIEKSFSSEFSGFSLGPVESKRLRSNGGIVVEKTTFANANALGREQFIR